MSKPTITPRQFIKAWAAQHPEFTGLVLVDRDEPRGRGGRKTNTVTRRFLAQAGKATASKTDYKKLFCGYRSNGECACCHRFYAAGLELMSVRAARIAANRRELIAYASICSNCRHSFQYPVATPINTIKLTMEAL